ncbi:MAG: AmmeMemoRadiSam system protein A [Gammaproteobacteria bacterium]|nr:AmmeMemoRadiSam system protein A [Gammaproteobacteria bacterium]
MSSINLSARDKESCLHIARESIRYGLEHGIKIPVNTHDYSPALQQKFATFVTLHINGVLRGCIGTLEAYQPLIDDVAEHAFAAAFSDPRFPKVERSEFELLDIEISVLSLPEEIKFTDENDLLNQIRPGIDGLIIEHGFNRGTFLPSVWQQLPDKREFFNHLKMKAGLPANWWDNNVKVSRYETLLF